MTKAFVLINVEPGNEENLLKDLKNIENIKEAYQIYGVYDMIAKVEAGNKEELKEIVAFKIRQLNNVRSTLTMIATEEI